MKKVICSMIILSCVSYLQATQPASLERFAHANEHYHRGDYQAALSLYESINHKGRATWYNMGNCHYALGNHAAALACWKHAEPNASATELKHIAHNTASARAAIGLKPAGGVWHWLYLNTRRVGHAFPLLALQLLVLLLWFAAMGYGARQIPWGKRYALVLLVLLAPALVSTYTERRAASGIVSYGGASLFAGPHAQYRQMCRLPAGEEVEVRDQRTGWYKVCHKEHVGWIPGNSLMVI